MEVTVLSESVPFGNTKSAQGSHKKDELYLIDILKSQTLLEAGGRD